MVILSGALPTELPRVVRALQPARRSSQSRIGITRKNQGPAATGAGRIVADALVNRQPWLIGYTLGSEEVVKFFVIS